MKKIKVIKKKIIFPLKIKKKKKYLFKSKSQKELIPIYYYLKIFIYS